MLCALALVWLNTVVGAGGGQVRFSRQQEAYILASGHYRCLFDAATGALRRVEASSGRALVLGNADGSLWRLRFRDGTVLDAAQAAHEGFAAQWDGRTHVLGLTWRARSATVTGDIRALSDQLQVRMAVLNSSDQPVLTLFFPNELAIAVDGLRLITWPESTGLGLTRKWFEPPAAEASSRWTDEALGDRLMKRLLGFGAQMLDLPGTARPARVTEDGVSVLGAGLARVLEGKLVTVVRPPEGHPDLVLIENDDGPYLVAFRLGGKGLFAYFAGPTDEVVATAVVPRLLRTWTEAEAGARVGVIALRGRAFGGWMNVTIDRWKELLPSALAGIDVAFISSPAQLRQALRDDKVAAIFNPYGEHLPATDVAEALAIVDEMRSFVRKGGIWLDASGYPLYYITKPARFGRVSGTYPPLFSDFIHVDAEAGSLAIYRVQPETEVFVPARMELRGAEVNGQAAGVFNHQFMTWVEPGKTWNAPTVVLRFGGDLPEAAREYARHNGFTKGLADKMPAEKLAKFVQSLLIRLHGRRAKDYLEYLPQLPAPNIIHMTEHLHVGFDAAYPDYLPPPPEFGTMDELRRLYRQARRLGFLMMPYVNPTWWCDRSPSLAKYGDTVLARGLDGKPYREAYGFAEPRNRGWSICALHPLVRRLDDRCLQQFVRDLGADILFQDQIGARGPKYDLNPAEPTPYAYTEGMLAIARHDSQYVPLSTERGWDRLIDYEVQFCGVSFAMVPKRGRRLWTPNFWETFADGEWACSPLALYMAHDKVAFALHDLGHFIDDERALAMALPLGHQLSLALGVGTPRSSARFRWLQWLDVLQKKVAAAYMLQPLESMRHITQMAIEARYGPLRVAGSLDTQPVRLAGVVMASPGYYVSDREGRLEAGRLVRYAGREYNPPLEFVKQREGRAENWWIYGSQEVLLPAGDAVRAAVVSNGQEQHVRIVRADGRRWVRARPPIAGVQPPPDLAHKPPARWPTAPRYIGIITMQPNGPEPGWADAGPDRWAEALSKSPVLSKLDLEVRELAAPEEVVRACASPRAWFAIVNPYGERFPVAGPEAISEMLQAVRQYVANGGIWWETGGFSFYYPCWPVREGGRVVRWQVGRGMGGLAQVIGSPRMLLDDLPAEPVRLTADARAILAGERAQEIDGSLAAVNRPLGLGYGGWVLMSGSHGPYVAGYRVEGWGWLFRVGGKGQIKLTLPLVEATLAHLFRTAPAQQRSAQPVRVWRVRIWMRE